MSRKTCYVGMPMLGRPEFEAVMAVTLYASLGEVDYFFDAENASLLAFNFNKRWCNFVNGTKDYPTFDYFCLCHADIGHEAGWLDRMIRELEASRFAALHAVVAIKDERGVTSTAVGPVEDEFVQVRKLTMHEVMRLPETFGYDEIRDELETPDDWCMLPNTGCLLVSRERFPVEQFPGFTINDRLSWRDGKRIADVSPEDWNFGRWCAANGIEVGATRAVVTKHYGRCELKNDHEWGSWKIDRNWTAAKVRDAVTSAP